MVYPVNNIAFKIGVKGTTSAEEDMRIISDMESFSITFDNGIEEWNPLDQEGWVRRLMTAKSLAVGLSGKRNYGDEGNDYAASLAYKNGGAATTVLEAVFPNGDRLRMSCVVNVTASDGGKAAEVAALELECLSDGKPVYTAAGTV